jgi:hypothetical protein
MPVTELVARRPLPCSAQRKRLDAVYYQSIALVLDFAFPCCFQRLHCCARVRLHRKPEGRAPVYIGRRKQPTWQLRGQEFHRREGIGYCQTPHSTRRNASVSAWPKDRYDVNKQGQANGEMSWRDFGRRGRYQSDKRSNFHRAAVLGWQDFRFGRSISILKAC